MFALLHGLVVVWSRTTNFLPVTRREFRRTLREVELTVASGDFLLDGDETRLEQVNPAVDRGTGGLGLGLTLVKRMTELHGGTIRALSDGLGTGSEFVVRLPLTAGRPDAPQADRRRSAAPATQGKRRVLVVEDTPDVREVLKEFLETLGHEVAKASTGPEGLEMIGKLRPEVALIDVGLPGIDGYELVRRSAPSREARASTFNSPSPWSSTILLAW
jgi:hypothetical protein